MRKKFQFKELCKQKNQEIFMENIKHNSVFQIAIFSCVRILIEIVIFKICKKYFVNYLHLAFIVNIAYMVGMTIFLRRKEISSQIHVKMQLGIGGMVTLELVLEGFIIPNLTYVYSGIVINFILWCVVLLMFIAILYIIIVKMSKEKLDYIWAIGHLFLLISLLLGVISESNLFYYDMVEYRKSALEGMCLYGLVILMGIVGYRLTVSNRIDKNKRFI